MEGDRDPGMGLEVAAPTSAGPSEQAGERAGRGGSGGEGLGTITLRYTLETPLRSRHSLLEENPRAC